MWSPKALVARWRRPYEAVAKDDPETAAEAETPPAAQPSPPKPPKRRSDSDLADLERNARAINVLCALHFVNFASLHLTSLPYPKLVNHLVNGDRHVSPASSYATGVLIACNSSAQFLCIKYWSCMSDAHGRKPFIILGMCALACYAATFAFATSVKMLAIGFLLEGTFATGWTIGQAYVVDCSTPDQRAKNYATYYGVAQGGALGVGAVCGLALLSAGIRAPFFAALALLLLVVPVALYSLPESLPEHRRTPMAGNLWRKASPWAAVAMCWRRGPQFRDVMLAYCLGQSGALFMANTWVNYTEAALGWTTLETGLSVVLYGALLTRIPPRVVARIGEARSLVHGLDVLAAVFLCFALVGLAGPKASVAVWPGVCLMVVGMTWDSAARSHASKLLPDSEQGSLQGTLSALTLMCNVVAGVLSNAVFGFFISPRAPVRWPGANFVVAAALVAAGGAVARRATRERD